MGNLQDKVRAHRRGSLPEILVAAVQMPKISNLQGPKDDPVNAHKHMADGEGRRVQARLAKDGSPVVVAVMGSIPGVVDAHDKVEEEGNEGEDLVGRDVLVVNLAVTGKGIGCEGDG